MLKSAVGYRLVKMCCLKRHVKKKSIKMKHFHVTWLVKQVNGFPVSTSCSQSDTPYTSVISYRWNPYSGPAGSNSTMIVDLLILSVNTKSCYWYADAFLFCLVFRSQSSENIYIFGSVWIVNWVFQLWTLTAFWEDRATKSLLLDG